MNLSNPEILCFKIRSLLSQMELLLQRYPRVFRNPKKTSESTYLMRKDDEFGGGHTWASKRENTFYFGYEHQNELLKKDPPETRDSTRFFEDYDYFYYHNELSSFTVFEDATNMQEYVTIPILNYDALTEDIIFQYSTVLSERSLDVYILSTLLRKYDVHSITLRLKHIDDISEETFWEGDV